MKPSNYWTREYLYELADMVDPDRLWRLPGLEQLELPEAKRKQLDAGVWLRRHGAHLDELARARAEGKSVLITPLSPGSTAHKFVATPRDHKKLERR